MRATLLAATCAALLMVPVGPLTAQNTPPPAVLVADRIDFSGQTRALTARGNVEVFYNGIQLKAAEIRYEGETEILTITGPITLRDDETTVIFADFAELSADLQQGLLRGARLVLDEQVQIAASEISRSTDGRYVQAYQTVASSCTVCASNPVPLWQIRSKRVIHDTEERQLYFDQAQFRVLGVPVLYLPQLRLPDPTLERTSGFLAPEFSSDDSLGTGVKIPYFFAIDDSRDLTLTPYVSTGGSTSLEARYRQAFARGNVEFNGALSFDDLSSEAYRGYIFGEGAFDLRNDYTLSFDLEVTSDPDYLLTYGISDLDRLNSRLAVSRVRRDSFNEAEIIAFQSLRDGDDNRFIPTLMSSVGTTRRFAPSVVGGLATVQAELHSHYRRGDDPAVGLSRDVVRVGLSAEWERSWLWRTGLVTRVHAVGHLDHFEIQEDPLTYPTGQVTRITPALTFEARLPLSRSGAGGVRHLLEPVVQAVLSRDTLRDAPNEDSQTVDFDEGNLFSASRFPGRDGREIGDRLNLGLTYTRIDPAGWNLGLTVGRILREKDLNQFNPGTGLDGASSDWLASVSLDVRDRLQLAHRALFDDQFTLARSETLLRYTDPRYSVTSGFTWLEADTAAGRPLDTSEWSLDAEVALAPDWTGQVDWRYDFVTNDASSAGVGLSYHSDCVRVDFNVARRFTATTTLRPTTTVGLSVELTGFGAGNEGSRGQRRSCAF
jgi:LPS-assembly protein